MTPTRPSGRRSPCSVKKHRRAVTAPPTQARHADCWTLCTTMFVTSLKWKLDADSIRGTPRTQGVFGLWDEDEIVYIGATERNVFLPDALRELLRLRRQGLI